MTCYSFSGHGVVGYVCCNDSSRLHVNGKYVWVSFHPYTGPSFYKNAKMTVNYDPTDENDPVWAVFETWYGKLKRQKEKRAKKV